MKLKSLAAAVVAALSTSAVNAGELTRVTTVPVGAEITGMFLSGDDLFFNVQHPSDAIEGKYGKASVGVISNVDFGKIKESKVPSSKKDKQSVVSSLGDYQVLVQEGAFGKIGKIEGKGGTIKISNDPDFNALVKTGSNEGYLFTNWEDRPGGMSRVKVSRNGKGEWKVDANDAKMIDFSGVNGTWVNCFGTLSPWNTPLSSEELYFDNTADWNNKGHKDIKGVEALQSYLGSYPNPYDYGYIVEITDPAASATPVKHFSLGRYSHENAVVMPDRKTVYMSDDGTGVVFFKFVADKAGDLSSGTLFAAKITQMGDAGASAADTDLMISWVELAHGTDAEISRWVREYDGISQGDYKAGSSSYISDEEIMAWAKGEAKDNRVAFLESRKAAVAKGATGEFRKMEGVNINLEGASNGTVPFMYMAMSAAEKTMSDDKGDIQLKKNKCGVVYEMKLDKNFNVGMMKPLVAGGKYDKNNKANACDVNGISNPDNLLVLDNGDVVIGEDTGKHENNAMWVWKK